MRDDASGAMRDQRSGSSLSPNDPVTPSHKGRLELTWTNKDLALLAHEDGSYEWAKYLKARSRVVGSHRRGNESLAYV